MTKSDGVVARQFYQPQITHWMSLDEYPIRPKTQRIDHFDYAPSTTSARIADAIGGTQKRRPDARRIREAKRKRDMLGLDFARNAFGVRYVLAFALLSRPALTM